MKNTTVETKKQTTFKYTFLGDRVYSIQEAGKLNCIVAIDAGTL
jgi:hypothetical protein